MNLRYEHRDSGWADNRISQSIQVVNAILSVLDRVEEIANGIPPGRELCFTVWKPCVPDIL